MLKEHILKGYLININRIKQLGKVIKILKRAENRLDAKQVLSAIESYSVALDLLDDYNHQRIGKPQGTQAIYVLTYDECKQVIAQMRFGAESDLFGNEKDKSFNASIGAIYQTFDGNDLYKSTQEKAANLLYFVTKNHIKQLTRSLCTNDACGTAKIAILSWLIGGLLVIPQMFVLAELATAYSGNGVGNVYLKKPK